MPCYTTSYSKSIIFNVDSYKVSMFNQYPPNTTGIYSYVESRGGHFDKTLSALAEQGWSADNIAFGMGGALLQKVDRDTQKFAMKCSSALIDNEWQDVQKDPATDQGKRFKAGQVHLFYNGDQYYISVNPPKPWADKGGDWQPVMVEVFRYGELLVDLDFSKLRENSMK